MPLATGPRLGPYEILAPIGTGGMGEVYRAKDTKLDREVAIKVLPAALAQDSERLARFEREAKVLASLNHPKIAQIYGAATCTKNVSFPVESEPSGLASQETTAHWVGFTPVLKVALGLVNPISDSAVARVCEIDWRCVDTCGRRLSVVQEVPDSLLNDIFRVAWGIANRAVKPGMLGT
jgi:serine/threonine protein kinase